MSVAKQFPIEKEYEKNSDISPEDVRKLREWLHTQPHLPGEYITDLDLVLAYHCCERSSEVTKQVLDLHFTLRTLFTSYFSNRLVDKKIDFVLETMATSYKAIYLRLLDADPRNFNVAETVRAFMMIFDLWQYEEGTWTGASVIIDMDQAVLGHVAKLEVMVIRQILYFVQECMLVKLKEVHFLNAPAWIDKLMVLIKPFMKRQLLEMLHIHQPGSQEIYNYVPKKAFPKEEGGDYKDHATIRDETIKYLHDNKQLVKDEDRRRVIEAKRPGKPASVEDIFGIQGNFKKLDID